MLRLKHLVQGSSERPPAATPGTYPDDPALLPPPAERLRGWVDLMMSDDGEGTTESEAKRDHSYGFLLLECSLATHERDLIWAVVMGALLRQADARVEGVVKSESTAKVARQVQLAHLLWHCTIMPRVCQPWMDRIFAMIKAESTHEELKIALLEYLATNSSSPDSLNIMPFLVERMEHESSDKVRACAVLALETQFRCMAGNEDKILSAKKWMTRIWGGVWRASEYLKSGDKGDDDVAEAQPDKSKAAMLRAGCGTITKAALAWSAVRSLVNPPVDAIEHALAVLSDDTQVAAAWATVPGGDALRPVNAWAAKYVPVTELLPPDMPPECQAKLDAYRAKKERAFSSLSPDSVLPSFYMPQLKHPTFLTFSFGKMMQEALMEVGAVWTNQHVFPRLLHLFNSLPQHTDNTLCVALLLDLILPEPLHKGTTVHDLRDATLISVLRRLAFEPAATSDDGSAEQGKAISLLEAKGLPGTREALQAFLDAPLEPHLVGRKWIPLFEGLDDENWAQLCESNPQATQFPSLIRDLASSDPKTQSLSLHKLYRSVLYQGNQATLAVAKWLIYLLDYPGVPDKRLLLTALTEMLLGGSIDEFLMVGRDIALEDPHNDRPLKKEIHEKVMEHMSLYLSLSGHSDVDTALAAIHLFAMCPDQWALTMPLLTAIFRDSARPLRVRGTALVALTFIVPLPSVPGEEEDKAERVRQVVALLGLCLPPPPGEAVALLDTAAARLAATGGDPSACLPEELSALVAHHALMADPAIRNDLQRWATAGVCRLVARARGVRGNDNDILAKLEGSPEFADRVATAVPIERELGLARWLPTARRQVLASAVVDDQHDPSSPPPSIAALKLKLLAGRVPRPIYPWVLLVNLSPLHFIFLFSS